MWERYALCATLSATTMCLLLVIAISFTDRIYFRTRDADGRLRRWGLFPRLLSLIMLLIVLGMLLLDLAHGFLSQRGSV